LSRESQSPGADAVSSAEGNTSRTHHRKVRTARRGRRTWHVQKLLGREPGDPTSGQLRCAALARIGKARSRKRCPPLPGSDVRATEGVLAVTPSGEDPSDRVRPLRSGARAVAPECSLRRRGRTLALLMALGTAWAALQRGGKPDRKSPSVNNVGDRLHGWAYETRTQKCRRKLSL
jgi:hypothetical protein